jgi:hypothetical protein
MFKSNSRFAALAEETPVFKETKNKNKKKDVEPEKVNNEGNSFKSNYVRPPREYEDRNQRNYYTNNLSKEQIERIEIEKKNKKEQEENIKAEKFIKDMASENFPTLVNLESKNLKNVKNVNCDTFLDKIKYDPLKKNKSKIEDIEYENLKPGWLLMKKDKNTNKITTKYKESNEPKPIKKTEDEYALDALNALVSLHEKRTEEYIKTWGYDAWENTFRSPNYDYEYFDKLDQEYEEAMEKIEENLNQENYSDFITDRDRYENYWKH